MQQIEGFVLQDRQITIEQLHAQSGLSTGSIHKILHKDLKMTRIAAKFIPKMLRPDELANRVNICNDWMDQVLLDPSVINHMVTGDESWVWCYDPESKRESSQWIRRGIDPRPQKFRKARSTLKVMITVFFDRKGIILVEYANGNVNAQSYIETLMNLRNAIWTKHPDLWREHNWILLDDNAPAHKARITKEFHQQVCTDRGAHPPYSPDLAPSDFFLFPKLKSKIRGQHYAMIQDLQEAVEDALQTFTQQNFEHCFDQLQERWEKCVFHGGHYFESDSRPN